MRVSRDARSGDSLDTLSFLGGTAAFASSALISLTKRVFSATSATRRSFCDDAWDRLSILACVSGDGPCLQLRATMRAIESHAPFVIRRLLVSMSWPPTKSVIYRSHQLQ